MTTQQKSSGERRIRDEALGALRTMLGEPSERKPDGEYWYVPRRPDGGGFDVHLNHVDEPCAAEIFVLAGVHRIYRICAQTEEDLGRGLRVVELIVRP